MEVLLDGRQIVSKEILHDHLAEKLNLPGYYGRNLDALYDLLSEPSRDLNITIVYADALVDNLGNYGLAVINTLREAACAFANIDFSVSNEII